MTINNNIDSIIRHVSKLSDNQIRKLLTAIDNENIKRSRQGFLELKSSYRTGKNGKILPKKLKKGTIIYELTKYDSYVDTTTYGMAQQKNARSYDELIKLGYR